MLSKKSEERTSIAERFAACFTNYGNAIGLCIRCSI